MVVIRRMVDRHRAYTAIFLKGEPPKIFPTSDYEHARILQIYKQDRPYEGILNDFSTDPLAAPMLFAASAPEAAKVPKQKPAAESPRRGKPTHTSHQK